MRPMNVALVVSLNTLLALATEWHGNQIGRFPVLSPLSPGVGLCRITFVNAELRRNGADRIAELSVDGEPQRFVSATATTRSKVLGVTASYSVPAGKSRRESEAVTAHFAPDGSLRFGQRHYYTSGIPATLADDRTSELSAADGIRALALAKSVLTRCAP